MTILHVIANLGDRRGGAEESLLRLSNQHPERSQVVVLGELTDSYLRRFAPAVDVRSLGCGNLDNPVHLGRAIRALSKRIADVQPEIVHAWMYRSNLVASAANAVSRTDSSVVWSIRNSLDVVGQETTKYLVWLSARVSGSVKAVVFNSELGLTQHVAVGFRSSNCVVAHNSFDIQTDVTSRSFSKPPMVGWAARIHRHKRPDDMLSVARQLAERIPAVEYFIAGAGSDEPEFARRVRLSKNEIERFRLGGQVADMASFFKAIDVLLVTSETEGFPNVVAEAMSFGVPVITTAVGDAQLIVGETGAVCDVGDIGGLTAAAERLLLEPASAASQRRRSAQNRIRNMFSHEKANASYHEIWSRSSG